MADMTIDEASQDDSVSGTEKIPVSDAGTAKSMSVSQIKDYVIEQLMASGAVTGVTNTWVMLRDSTGASKRIAIDDFKAALESMFATLAGAQTITGAKTFTGAVSVPSPTANGHAATRGYVDDALADKVDKVTGKSLSSNDFTDALLTKLNGIASGAQVNAVSSVNTKTGAVTLNATDVGAASNEPTFTQAETLAAPVGTGETTPTLWGKVWKAITTLVSHIGDSVAHVTAVERAEWSGKQGVLTFDEYPTALSNNPVKSKGILQRLGLKADSSALADHANDTNAHVTAEEKSSWDQKQSTENLVTSFQSSPDNTHYPSEKLVKDSLDEKADSSDLTTHASNTTVHVTAADKTAWNGKQAALVVGTNMDTTPTSGSNNPVTSGGVYTAIQNAGGGSSVDVVTSWESTTSNAKVPSEKLVKDTLDLKQTTANIVTEWGSTPSDSKYPSEKLVKDSIDGIYNIEQLNHDTTLTNSSKTPTLNIGTSSSKFYAFTDGRTSGGDVRITFNTTYSGSSNYWQRRRAHVIFTAEQGGRLNFANPSSSYCNMIVRSKDTEVTYSSSYDGISMTAGNTYLIEATFFIFGGSGKYVNLLIEIKEYAPNVHT